MAETLVQFQAPVSSTNGVFYKARACAGEGSDRLWHGWIEFIPVAGGQPIRSSRETTQPNRQDAYYWATGLTAVYLEGALRRALAGPVSIAQPGRPERPAFEKPAPPLAYSTVGSRDSALDPFSVYAKGEHLLRRQLGALSEWHLVNIVLGYDLTDEPVESLNRRPTAYLIELIVKTVRERQAVANR